MPEHTTTRRQTLADNTVLEVSHEGGAMTFSLWAPGQTRVSIPVAPRAARILANNLLAVAANAIAESGAGK